MVDWCGRAQLYLQTYLPARFSVGAWKRSPVARYRPAQSLRCYRLAVPGQQRIKPVSQATQRLMIPFLILQQRFFDTYAWCWFAPGYIIARQARLPASLLFFLLEWLIKLTNRWRAQWVPECHSKPELPHVFTTLLEDVEVRVSKNPWYMSQFLHLCRCNTEATFANSWKWN